MTIPSATESSKTPPPLTAASGLIDLAVVFLVSSVAYAIEQRVARAGWIAIPEAATGVSAVVAGFCCVIMVIYLRQQPLAELGFRRPDRWWPVPCWVVGILVLYIGCELAVPSIVGQYYQLPTPDLSRYDSIYRNLPAALAMGLVLPLTASIPEEVIYRGFLIDRLTQIFGRSVFGTILTVVVQALVFGSIHFQWGLGGMIVTFIMGLIWGSAFLLSGRNLWIVILAHSSAHVLLVAQLYFVKASELGGGG